MRGFATKSKITEDGVRTLVVAIVRLLSWTIPATGQLFQWLFFFSSTSTTPPEPLRCRDPCAFRVRFAFLHDTNMHVQTFHEHGAALVLYFARSTHTNVPCRSQFVLSFFFAPATTCSCRPPLCLTLSPPFFQHSNLLHMSVTVFGLRVQLLKKRFTEVLPTMQKSLQELVKTHGNVSLGNVTIDQAVGGARGVPCLLWETSLLNEQTVSVSCALMVARLGRFQALG